MLQVLFWSVIAAAFVGPGTVTTCARAGVDYRYALLWALAFSIATCLVLQEASARVTVVSGRNLGQALRARYRSGLGGLLVPLLVTGAIVVGSAAYQAGNLLGAAAGASLVSGQSTEPARGPLSDPGAAATLVSGALAGLLLWFARTQTVARLMGLVVAVMGSSFLVTAVLLRPPWLSLLRGLAVPVVPEGAGVLTLGLIGTTVVPYNLFLGSSLAHGQSLREIRFGLSVAIALGGLISMAILVVGSAVAGPFSFDGLAETLTVRLGGWARWMFAVGLFCAGFSSAITAPLAAAITARSLFERRNGPPWHERSWRYRAVWLFVLLVGVASALTAVRPVQVIVLAQALNGVLLPFVAIFLLVVVNDRELMGKRGLNHWAGNLAMSSVVAVTLLLGLWNLWKAFG